MHPIIHQTNFQLLPTGQPKRIISLVPSQTEMLQYFGLDERVVGITRFCIHPDYWFTTKNIIGGTKKVDIQKVLALQPDLIIANKEENEKEQIEALASICPVYVSDIKDLNTAFEMMLQVGLLVGARLQSEALVNIISGDFDTFESRIRPDRRVNPVSVAYFVWQKPYMAAGGGTFINDLLCRCGLKNVFRDQLRYPVITLQSLKEANPQVLLLSSEPFQFGEKHKEELQDHLPNTKIRLVDGEIFSWYGSRLLKATSFFQQLLEEISIHSPVLINAKY